jgi:hypothetical protein
MISFVTIIIALTALGFVVFIGLSLRTLRNSSFDAAQLFQRHIKEILAMPGMQELLTAAKFDQQQESGAEKPGADDRVNAASEN